ncbi:unnamed protein product, partial [Protopolystoma xenopodis]
VHFTVIIKSDPTSDQLPPGSSGFFQSGPGRSSGYYLVSGDSEINGGPGSSGGRPFSIPGSKNPGGGQAERYGALATGPLAIAGSSVGSSGGSDYSLEEGVSVTRRQTTVIIVMAGVAGVFCLALVCVIIALKRCPPIDSHSSDPGNSIAVKGMYT